MTWLFYFSFAQRKIILINIRLFSLHFHSFAHSPSRYFRPGRRFSGLCCFLLCNFPSSSDNVVACSYQKLESLAMSKLNFVSDTKTRPWKSPNGVSNGNKSLATEIFRYTNLMRNWNKMFHDDISSMFDWIYAWHKILRMGGFSWPSWAFISGRSTFHIDSNNFVINWDVACDLRWLKIVYTNIKAFEHWTY